MLCFTVLRPQVYPLFDLACMHAGSGSGEHFDAVLYSFFFLFISLNHSSLFTIIAELSR
jgi:hypothetical protein